jgi:type I restriction enzyme, S subunit
MEVRPGYKQTEIGAIPEDWEVSPLEEFTSFISYGFTNPMPTSESGIYMITAKDINYGRIEFDTARCTTVEAYRNLLTAKSRPEKGDLLLTKDGTLGRLALVDDRTVCINQSVAILRPNSKAVPQFLKVLLEAPAYQIRMLEDSGGSTIKHIYITIVNQMPVAVPPTKAEQEAIAEALSDADSLIESLEQLIAKKRHLKHGAMQELLRPKDGWVVKELQEISEIDPESLGVNTRPSYAFKYISLEDVDRGMLLGWSEEIFSTAPSRARRKVKKGDVLISTVRPKLQSHYLIEIDWNDLICSTGFSAVRCRPCVAEPRYVFECFFSFAIERQIEAIVTGSNYPAINSSDVKRLKIPVPPTFSEQTAIAENLSDMDAEIAALEAKLAKVRQIKQGMMQELLIGRIRLV